MQKTSMVVYRNVDRKQIEVCPDKIVLVILRPAFSSGRQAQHDI